MCLLHLHGGLFSVSSTHRSVTPWNPERHAISLSPNYLEMFLRTFLSEKLSIASGAEPRNGSHKCAHNTDCSSKLCNSVRMECVAGVCRCLWAHYHIAMDIGLIREETPGMFRVIDDDQPLWAEPIWDSIGMFTYLDYGSSIGYVETSKVLLLLCYSVLMLYFFYVSSFSKICGSHCGIWLNSTVHHSFLYCNFFSSKEKDAMKNSFSCSVAVAGDLSSIRQIRV